MISVNGRAFRSLLDSGFQAIIQSKLNKFKAAGCAINMNDKLTDVKDLMHEMANKVKMKIKEEVNGRMLSPLIDIGTKNRRSIFGVSIQYRVNGVLKIRSIGMIELHKSHTASFLTDLAKHLLHDIEERKETIFKNPLMAAALLLDPRFRRQIKQNEDKLDEAKRALMNIWRRLKFLETNAGEIEDMSVSINEKSPNSSFEFDETAALNDFLTGNQDVIPKATEKETDIEHLLDIFDPPVMSADTDVVQFWQDNKEEQKELYELAMIVFSIPPTEVKIETDFSKLNFVFTDRRCNLTEERLEDIMTIHLNEELFHQVKEDLLKTF